MPEREIEDVPKRKKFIEEYLKDLNGSQAAIRAGYKAEWAKEIAYQLLHETTLVKDEIAQRIAARAERAQVTHEKVIQEISKLAFAPISDEPKWEGDEVVLRWNDLGIKTKNLENLGKHVGMFEPIPVATVKELIARLPPRVGAILQALLSGEEAGPPDVEPAAGTGSAGPP